MAQLSRIKQESYKPEIPIREKAAIPYQLIINLVFGALLGYLIISKFLYNDKIVYVDSVRLLEKYQGMIDAKEEYAQKAKVWQSNIDTLTARAQKAIKDYDKASSTMTQREQKLSKELISMKQRQLTDYQQGIQQKAHDEDLRLSGTVLKIVNTYLETYGKRRGYKVILVANQSGNIAYAEKGMNITDDVVMDLNGQYKKEK